MSSIHSEILVINPPENWRPFNETIKSTLLLRDSGQADDQRAGRQYLAGSYINSKLTIFYNDPFLWRYRVHSITAL